MSHNKSYVDTLKTQSLNGTMPGDYVVSDKGPQEQKGDTDTGKVDVINHSKSNIDGLDETTYDQVFKQAKLIGCEDSEDKECYVACSCAGGDWLSIDDIDTSVEGWENNYYKVTSNVQLSYDYVEKQVGDSASLIVEGGASSLSTGANVGTKSTNIGSTARTLSSGISTTQEPSPFQTCYKQKGNNYFINVKYKYIDSDMTNFNNDFLGNLSISMSVEGDGIVSANMEIDQTRLNNLLSVKSAEGFQTSTFANNCADTRYELIINPSQTNKDNNINLFYNTSSDKDVSQCIPTHMWQLGDTYNNYYSVVSQTSSKIILRNKTSGNLYTINFIEQICPLDYPHYENPGKFYTYEEKDGCYKITGCNSSEGSYNESALQDMPETHFEMHELRHSVDDSIKCYTISCADGYTSDESIANKQYGSQTYKGKTCYKKVSTNQNFYVNCSMSFTKFAEDLGYDDFCSYSTTIPDGWRITKINGNNFNGNISFNGSAQIKCSSIIDHYQNIQDCTQKHILSGYEVKASGCTLPLDPNKSPIKRCGEEDSYNRLNRCSCSFCKMSQLKVIFGGEYITVSLNSNNTEEIVDATIQNASGNTMNIKLRVYGDIGDCKTNGDSLEIQPATGGDGLVTDN